MLLILLFVAIFVVSTIITCKTDKYKQDVLHSVAQFIAVMMVIILIILAIVVTANLVCADADTAKMSETYESLYDQCNYNMYANDRAKKKLADQVTEWNEDLAAYQEFKKSIWVSWFYPIDTDQFHKIPVGMVQRTVG